MKPFSPLSVVTQLAAHLREEILRGNLRGLMPGVHHLRVALGTSPQSMVDALKLLEREGILKSQGPGRRSRILIPDGSPRPALRVEIMPYDKADRKLDYMLELKHQLLDAGHTARFSTKSLQELGMDVKRVARHVGKAGADAWVVVSASQAVLEWFHDGPLPTMALFGCHRDVPGLAGVGPEKKQAMAKIVQQLTELGHRRIALLVREEKRLPHPGNFERYFLGLLTAAGIGTSRFNLPDWQGGAAGLNHCLDTMFRHTAPTAIIFDEAPLFAAARLHLAQRGIISPRDVSVVCLDPDPDHVWFEPGVSHVTWDSVPILRRVLQWTDNASRGKADKRKIYFKTDFITGGTIGPVKE